MELQLRRIMAEKNINGQQLADQLGVTKQFVSNIVRGGSASIRLYEKIAECLNVPLWTLFAPPTEKDPKPDTDIQPDLTITDRATGETRHYRLI